MKTINRPVYSRLAAFVIGAVAASASFGQQSASRKPFDFETWDQYLGGTDSSQYSSLDQIDRSNVTDLEVAWTFETGQKSV